MRERDDPVVNQIAQAKLSQRPNAAAGEQDPPPAEAHSRGKQEWREEEKRDVHGKNIEQRRSVEKKDRSNDGDKRMREIEIEEIADGGLVGLHGEGRRDGEGERQHHEMVAVDSERALPQAVADAGCIVEQVAKVDAADKQRRNEHKTFGGRDKAQRGVDEVTEARRQMRQRHPDEE